ncbi:RNA methyltransferase [Leptotrichia sp. OH3620_COT-345]|uniref:RNA methyltransferase n=1 Tax=Leptotrichia sp. OH3620_COT-345 TaxID=2491048 RepID=UPI000F650A9B|nr:RNA methyltransferase [Leptotrichia sp. OH3620_COT-345]RRD40106.1 RNA methyltransferase [Leptotrichia sp. OH3620_COT-345]
MRNNIYTALVHYPVYNRNNDTVATSVTNFDIHDISRTCRTYDIKKYFIITPVDAQQELTKRIIDYWIEGDGIEFNKNRNEAFENTVLETSVQSAVEAIYKNEGKMPRIITTSAKIFENTVSYEDLGKEITTDENPYLILFGTGWGLTEEIMNMSYKILEPIRGKTKYNHLSVRSAVSIILDRLLGEK